jgi:hypothetical protein
VKRLLLFVWMFGCGASEQAADPAPVEVPREEEDEQPAREEPEPEPREEEPRPEPEPPAAVIEAGARLGAIRIGMTQAEVTALGLEETEADSRSRRFGPYQIYFDGETVRRVEARFGDLGRVEVGGRTYPVGTTIYELRDAIGDCEWTEGGGERYRCAGGSLLLQTDHTLDPAFYRFIVERR